MNAEQKQRAKDLIVAWKSTAYALHADRMAALLQELVEAAEVEPALVVEVEPDYWHRGHYCEGSKPYINPLEVWKLPVGTKLYTVPPAQSEPVGYLYTNVQSGESHVSDYDDDYRGPERALWYIEPVYRRTKGQS